MLTPLEAVVAVVLAAAVLLPCFYWRQLLELMVRYVLTPVRRFIMANLLSVAILATVFIVPVIIIYWDGMIIAIREVFNIIIIISLVIIVIFVVGVFKDTHRRGVVDNTTEKRK